MGILHWLQRWLMAPRKAGKETESYGRRFLSQSSYLSLGSLSFIILVSTWCLVTYGGLVQPYFLSSPTQVYEAAHNLLVMQNYAGDIAASVIRIVVGFLASAVLAIPLGILIGRSQIFEAIFAPITSFVRYLPVPALLPFCILWLGIGEVQKISIVFVGVFFQLVLMIADISRNIPPELLEIAYTLGTTPRMAIIRVVLPYSAPLIFDGLRITLGWAWGWVMLAELVGASQGIGYMILKSQRYLLNANMIVGLLTVGLLGLATDLLFAGLNRALFRWRQT